MKLMEAIMETPKMTTAAEAVSGVDYRIARRSKVLKGLVFTIPSKSKRIITRLEGKGGAVTCKEMSILTALQKGHILAFRHLFGRKAETGERYTSKELVALPPDTPLRALTRQKTKTKGRKRSPGRKP